MLLLILIPQAQDNIIELNKSRLRALEELKAARAKIAELGAQFLNWCLLWSSVCIGCAVMHVCMARLGCSVQPLRQGSSLLLAYGWAGCKALAAIMPNTLLHSAVSLRRGQAGQCGEGGK